MGLHRRTRGRRGVVIALAALVALLVIVDLLRPDSILQGYLRAGAPPTRTPLGRLLDDLTP